MHRESIRSVGRARLDVLGRLGLALPLLLSLCCSSGGPKRPRVDDVPEGMIRDANLESARLVLPEFELLDQDGWMSLNEPSRSIVFSQFGGTASAEDVAAAWEAAALRYTSEQFGEIEPLRIDGRESWGWFARQYIDGELAAIEFTAVVPYADCTWTVEYFVSEPGETDGEEELRALVSSFRPA